MDNRELNIRFTYYTPTSDQEDCCAELDAKVRELAGLIDCTCLDSREKSLAFTKLEECLFWANASITRLR